MKRTTTTKTLKLLGTLVLGLSAGAAFAGDQFWNFDDATNPTNGFTIVGSHSTYYYETNGNPDTGGYLSIADGPTGGQNLVCVFPDIDQGYPVKAFHLTMDVRAGNGASERPADGFSISYCREGDPVLVGATNGVAQGAAGGDDAATTLNPNGSGDFENGAKSGVAICFDAWQGNMLPDTGAGGTPGPDVEGIEVRVDDKTLKQLDLQADRNGTCSAANGADISSCSNGVCADFNTEQTGPWLNDGGSVDALCWVPLDVELDTNKQVTVIWKGHTIVDHYQLAQYSSHRGRLVIMGRTGGAEQNAHFDNIHLVTVPAVEATFGAMVAGPGLNKFTFTIDDNGNSLATNVSHVVLDGVDVTSSVAVTKSGGTTTGVYTQPANFPSGSSHSVDITWQTTLGQTLTILARTFTIINWKTLSASMSVPASSIDLAQPGFAVQAWQNNSGDPNRMYWADEQLMGLHGTNYIDFSGLTTTPSGEVNYSDVIDFANTGAGGQFANNNGWDFFGIPAGGLPNDNNSAIAASTYLYFPQAGTYIMGGNSDDGLRVTFAKNSHDLLGTRVPGLFADVGRGVGSYQNLGAVIVDTPGYYGFRLLWENGGGGSAVEWYFTSTPGSGATNILINDVNGNPATTIKAYQVSSAAPPYVSYAEPPLDDDQVLANTTLEYHLTDASTTVTANSIVLKVNGVTQSPAISSSGGVTKITQAPPAALWTKGVNNIELSFNDSANTNYDYQYSFTVLPYATLDPSQSVPLGSQDGTKPGFVLSTAQIDFASVADAGDGIPNQEDCAYGMISGAFFPWYGANASTAPGPSAWTGVLDFAVSGSTGDFTNDFTLPGIPGTGLNTDNIAALFQFWLEFPTAGFYRFGGSSDDGFRLGEGFAPARQTLHVTGAGIDKDVGSVVSQKIDGNGGFGATPPSIPLVAPVMYVDSSTCPNLPNLAGKIAVADTKLCGLGDGPLVLALQNAGAVGAILINAPGNGFPYTMNSNPGGTVTIPALNVSGFHGERDFWITNANLTASIGAPAPIELGGADYGKGMGWVDFGFNVPAAGIYPLHLIYENGGGGAGLEFAQLLPDGTRVLLNDSTVAGSLKAYRAVTAVSRPTLTAAKVGGVWQITFTGHLYSAPSVAGPWTVTGATSPFSPVTTSGSLYYRSGP